MATNVAEREPEVAEPPSDGETEAEASFAAEPETSLPPPVREHYDAIRRKEQTVRQLERVFLDAKRQAKNAKENFDAADLDLRNLIADGLDPQARLPFPAEAKVEADPDAWRLVPLDELFLPEKIGDKLLAAGIDTIGELEDLRAEISEGEAEWPKGIGPSKVTAIEDSVLAWLSDHRDHWGEPVENAGAAAAV